MFCRRYRPAFPDMFDLSFQPRRMEDSFVPREFLALINPWEEQQKCGGKVCDRRSGKMRRNMAAQRAALCQKSPNERPTISVEPWQTSVPTEGFTPEDLMIYLQGRTVVVNGRQSQGDEETGIVSKQFKRRITLPSNFIIPSLDVGFEDGNVVLSGRRRVIKRKEEKPDKETIADRSMTGNENGNIAVNVNKNDESSDTCECEEPKNCENCDCSKSSSSEEVVMEDLGPEVEDGGRMEISAESCEKSESENDNEESEAAKEVSKEVQVSKEKSEDTEEKRLEVSKTTSSEICEYKPMTWSIPFDGFDASDVKVHLEDDVVRVFAEHKDEQDGMTSFRRMERSFTLPESVDSNTLSSRFNTDDKKLRIEVMPNKKSSE